MGMRKTDAEWLLRIIQCAGRNNSRLVFILAFLRFVLLQHRQHNPCACPKALNLHFLKRYAGQPRAGYCVFGQQQMIFRS